MENLPSSDTDVEEHIFTVTLEERKAPKKRIKISNVSVDKVVDTGASIDVMDKPNIAALQQSAYIQLQRSKSHIFAYGANNDLNVLGKFEATFESKAKITV